MFSWFPDPCRQAANIHNLPCFSSTARRRSKSSLVQSPPQYPWSTERWRTCSFGLKDNPRVLKKKQIEDWRNLLKGVQLLRSWGFSQILNKLTFLNLLCEFFKQELNPKLYWVVTDTEYWASNIFKWSTRKPPWILWHFTAGKQSTSHPNKKNTLHTSWIFQGVLNGW